MKSLNLNLIYHNATRSIVDADQISNTIKTLLDYLNINGKIEVDVSIVGTTRMRSLNRQHRSVNSPTDVLSFPHINNGQTSKTSDYIVTLGSIVICPKIVAQNNRQKIYQNLSKPSHMGLNQSILYVLAHGVLHLLGYDHETDGDEFQFDNIIRNFFVTHHAKYS